MKQTNVIMIFSFALILFMIFIFYFKLVNTVNSEYKESENVYSEVVASDLNIPWEIEFLPNDEMIVTERVGNLVRIDKKKNKIEVDGVKHIGEGGLLGMTLHPDFKENGFIYLYFTSEIQGKIENRVERYFFDLENNLLIEREVILEGIPGAVFHDGGRIKFGPDDYLYITTGDAGKENNAQDKNSLAGKILRIDSEGSIPKDNSFNNKIYSYGHRNSQGLAWDDNGKLWATEHGRSGIQSGFDELNLIEKGKNYGWPVIEGNEKKDGMESPVIHSGPDDTWAPAGAVYYSGKIFFTGLKGESLYEYDIETGKLESHFKGEFGRLRAIALNRDYLYISTSNTDGRGKIREGDDKIIRIKTNELVQS